MGIFSLFSGCGGCSLGLKQAGLHVNLAVDINKDACDTYSSNLPDSTIWCADLSRINPNDLLKKSNINRNNVNLIIGGPPCQGFSSAGARDWADPRNILMRNFVEIVTVIRPVWFIMENVEGLITANNGIFLIEAITRFLQAGYWVRTEKVYLEKYGLPQSRKRVIIVGNLENCNFNFPQPTYFKQPTLFNSEQSSLLSVLDAIGDLPPPNENQEILYEKDAQNEYQRKMRRRDGLAIHYHQIKRLNEATQQRIVHLKQGDTMKDLPVELQHPSFERRSKRRVMDGTPTEKRGGAPSGLKRLVAHDPSLTITSGSASELIHPNENRPLTLRECARIQSFPDWYEFQGSWSSIATQIGNAIPPLYMEILVRHIQNLATWHRVENPQGKWLGINATKSNGKSPILIKVLTELRERTHVYANV